MRRLLFVFAVLSAAALADEPGTKFLWYRIGMNFEDLRAVSLENCSNKAVQNCQSKIEIGGKTRQVRVSIKNDKLQFVSFSLVGNDDFIVIERMLTDRYGKPTDNKISTVQNSYGAQFEKVRLVWTTHDAYISASNMIGKVGEGGVTFHDRASFDAEVQALKSAPNPF